MQPCYLYQLWTILVLSTLYVVQVQTTGAFQRIMSGNQAAEGQFPWQVILKRHKFDDVMCGGSIIAKQWVLTAAHCTEDERSILLVFGTIDLDNDDINMTSSVFFQHPKFNSKTLNNDVALIKLPRPLKYTRTVRNIRLLTSKEASKGLIGAQATIIGFGRTSDQSSASSKMLLWAHVNIIKNSVCDEYFVKGVVRDSTICSKGDSSSKPSICKGDSGGPLVWKNKANKYVQIGINSFSIGMCKHDYPSGYARITSYMGFIQRITGIFFDY